MIRHKLQKLADIFQKVQQSQSTHKKCCTQLENIFQESNFDEFVAEFMKYLKALILNDSFTQNPYVNKVLNFCVRFCISVDKHNKDEDVTCPFLEAVFNSVLKLHNVANARYRVCQFINILLREMGENESFLDEEICENIRDIMLERIEDLRPGVRFQAVEVLQRLQDPQDSNDAIIKTYIKCLPDNSAQVRGAIIRCIGLNMTTIPIVLGRCLDSDSNVRLVSYDKFSKIPISALKVEHRQHILKNGFKDQSTKVRQFVENTLLPQWFTNCNENYYKLILALKLDADENDFKQTIEIIERVLEIFFKKNDLTKLMEALPLGNEKLITSGEINWEEFIFWRCLVRFLRNKEKDGENELVDQIIPELSFFSKYLKKVYQTRSECKNDWEIMHHDYIMMELLKICRGYDFSDEVGRRSLYKTITYIITDAQLSFKNVQLLTEIFEQLCTDIESFAKEICTLVSEIREPMTVQAPSEEMIRKKEVKCAEIRIKIDIALDDQEKAIERKDFMKAQELKMKITELRNQVKLINQEFGDENARVRIIKNDVHTLSKCLDLLTAMMQSPNVITVPEALQLTVEQLVQPLLVSTNAEIFSRALTLTGYCCSVNEEMAKKSINLFTAPILAHKYMPMYDDQTTMTAIDCLTDMIMLYGSDILQSSADGSINLTKRSSKKRLLFTESQIVEDTTVSQAPPTASLEVIIETLADLLDDDMPEIRLKSVESIVKLICAGSIRSSMLLTKLILKWFNPTTVRDQRLRQLIAQLFIDYTHEVPSSLEVIEQSYIPTLQAIMDAPLNSPLADVDMDSVLSFLAILSKPADHKYNVGLDSHKNIALTLCREICDRPNNKMTPVYLRGLIHLTVPSQDEVAICDLRKQVDLMFELITDKQYQKYLLKYKSKLEGADELVTLAQNNVNVNTNINTNANTNTNTNTNINTDTNSNSTINNSNNRQTLNNVSTEVVVNSTIAEELSTLTSENIHVQTPLKSANENDPKVANTTYKFATLSVSVKRRKRRNGKTNNDAVEQVQEQSKQTEDNENIRDSIESDQSNKSNSSPKVILTETDSDNASVKSKQIKTAVRRSMRKRNRK